MAEKIKSQEEADALEAQLATWRTEQARKSYEERKTRLKPVGDLISSPEFAEVEKQVASLELRSAEDESVAVHLRSLQLILPNLRQAAERALAPPADAAAAR